MVYDRSLTQRLRRTAGQLGTALQLEPGLRRKGQVVGLRWSEGDLVYDGPRFGVAEIPLAAADRETWGLAVVRGLQSAPAYVLEWVLWREAFLGLLNPRIRLVPEVADLGLYAGLKYGISNREQRQALQRIWERVSPPHSYEFYSYQPAVGFGLIDEVMEGAFLREAVSWLNSLRGGSLQLMSSAAYTAALERWMMEIHCILSASELRVLQYLTERPGLSQRQLAQRVRLSPAAVSGVLKSLARRHLLRVASRLNFPLVGLYPVAVDFRCPSAEILEAVRTPLLEHPSARLVSEFGDGHVVAVMLIPVSRMGQFQAWTDRLRQRLQAPRSSIQLATEVVSARCFDLYEARRGWTRDFWPVLLRIQSIMEGEEQTGAPFLHRFRYSNEAVRTGTLAPIQLQPTDFAWFEGVDRPITVASKASSSVDREARQLGLSAVETKRYRRRLQWLDERQVRSQPILLGLLHIGLDVELRIRLQTEVLAVRRIVQAVQFLPSLVGVIFENGGALLTLLLPQGPAVDVYNFLRSVFAASDIDASLELEPAWRTFGTHVSTLNPSSYDFSRGDWMWSEPAL